VSKRQGSQMHMPSVATISVAVGSISLFHFNFNEEVMIKMFCLFLI